MNKRIYGFILIGRLRNLAIPLASMIIPASIRALTSTTVKRSGIFPLNRTRARLRAVNPK